MPAGVILDEMIVWAEDILGTGQDSVRTAIVGKFSQSKNLIREGAISPQVIHRAAKA